MPVAHHAIPPDAPHPDGNLNAVDALERSCNVFYENVAMRMGTVALLYPKCVAS